MIPGILQILMAARCVMRLFGPFTQGQNERNSASIEFNPDLKRREEIIKLLEKLEMEKSQIEQKLKLFLGDCEMAQNSNYQISWSNVDSIRLDGKRLKEEYPELYQQFSRTSHSRRFAVRVA